MTQPLRRTATGFDHAALIVESDATFDRLLVPILRRHLSAGDPVLLVVSTHTESVLRDRLGASAPGTTTGRWWSRSTTGAHAPSHLAPATAHPPRRVAAWACGSPASSRTWS